MSKNKFLIDKYDKLMVDIKMYMCEISKFKISVGLFTTGYPIKSSLHTSQHTVFIAEWIYVLYYAYGWLIAVSTPLQKSLDSVLKLLNWHLAQPWLRYGHTCLMTELGGRHGVMVAGGALTGKIVEFLDLNTGIWEELAPTNYKIGKDNWNMISTRICV